MFGLFSSRKTKLEKKYQRLLEDAFRLSHVNRKESDFKQAEADEVLQQMKALESAESQT